MTVLCLVIRLALGGMFLYAGLIKASASEQFALALVPFTFVPTGWIDALAATIAYAEIAAGLLILVPRVYPLGAAAIACLAALFIGVLGWALANGIVVDCGCFGRDEEPSAAKMWAAVLRDIAILAGAALVLIHGLRRRTARAG